jgi:hypothetical protein
MPTLHCEKCNKTFYSQAHWKRHISTTKHKTGFRSDKKEDYKCDKCNYQTKYISNFKLHNLNNHSSKKEREKNFPYYCKACDYGCLDEKLMNNHFLTLKHLDKNKKTLL